MSRPIGANSESRPSDLWTNSSKPKPTIPRSGSTGPTMRVKEVALAPGAKTRSHLQLMQNTHRAATGGWTSSSIHPPDSHMMHGTRAPQYQPDNGGFPLQEGNGAPAYLDPAASNPLENNLRQQRDLLASQMDMMRQSRENFPPSGSPTNDNNGVQPPLMGALPPLTAPYGSQCCASQPPFSAVGKYNTTYLGNQIGGGVVPNRLGYGPSSTALLQKKINGGTTAQSLGSKKAREEIESLQTALQEQNDEMDRLRSENEQLRSECIEARRSADEIASHQDDSEQRVHAAQRAMDRAREMQRRAEVALEHQSETIDSIQKESMMYRLEWERCLEYMAKFGGIGKDYHNNHSGGNAIGMNQEALMDASKRHLTEDDGVTDENCAELVNRILQGDHSLIPPVCGNGSEAGGGAFYPVPSQNAVDPATASNGMASIESGPPHRLILGDSPHGTEGGGVVCGRLGLVALTHRLLQEHANVVSQLKASRERNHSLIISLQQVNQREAQSAADMVAMENEFQKAQERLRVGEVLLADVRGEAEYLRGIVGEHTETISRLVREMSGLQSRVRDEVGQRAAAEGRVDAAEDTAKKASNDIIQREIFFKKTMSEMQYDIKCLDARLLESENAKAVISHEKDHIAYQLNYVRTTIAQKLDGLLEAGTGRDTGEAVRQAQERAAREAGQLAQTIASLRNELFADCPAPPPPPFVQPHPANNPNTSYHAPHGNFPPDESHQPIDYRAHYNHQSHNNNYSQHINPHDNNHPIQPVDYTAPLRHNHTVAPPPQASGGVSLYHGSIKVPKGNVDPTAALTEASSSKEHRREAAEARAAAHSQIQTKNAETSSVAVDQPVAKTRVSTPPQPKSEGGEV